LVVCVVVCVPVVYGGLTVEQIAARRASEVGVLARRGNLDGLAEATRICLGGNDEAFARPRMWCDSPLPDSLMTFADGSKVPKGLLGLDRVLP